MQLVKCPNCERRFPVNLKKHLDRRERLCPKCYEEVVIRRRFAFTPNAEWIKQRQVQAEKNRLEKQMKQLKRMGLTPTTITLPGFQPKPKWEDERR